MRLLVNWKLLFSSHPLRFRSLACSLRLFFSSPALFYESLRPFWKSEAKSRLQLLFRSFNLAGLACMFCSWEGEQRSSGSASLSSLSAMMLFSDAFLSLMPKTALGLAVSAGSLRILGLSGWRAASWARCGVEAEECCCGGRCVKEGSEGKELSGRAWTGEGGD